ncbi:MAG: hypothetical protein ABIB61_01685 [Candidatus Shapirobacteria bacterium]
MNEYVKYPTAQFQKTIFQITEKALIKEFFLMAFRGSGKSTILTMSYPIWAIVGVQQKKFVLIISRTQNQSNALFYHVRRELESNLLLKNDFGPFMKKNYDWSSNTLEIPKYGARITCASVGESIRGIRHGSFRPDLIILDDVEDKFSVRTFDGREKTRQWYSSEIRPLGDFGTRIIAVGTMLHDDSLMMKLKDYDDNIGMHSVFLRYPLIDENDKIAWPEKFTRESIEELKTSMLHPNAFDQEYLLLSVPEDNQIIKREWIRYYDKPLPNEHIPQPRMILMAIDLAIKKGDGRDYTSIVPMYVTGYDKNLRVYMLPYIVNKQLDFPETVTEVLKLNAKLQKIFNIPPKIYVESVGYQDSLVQQLFTVEKIAAEPVNVGRLSKPERLSIVSPYVEAGKVFFYSGMDGMISQLLNIFSTKHDDMADAFTMGLSQVIKTDRPYYQLNEPAKPTRHWHTCPITGEYRNFSVPIMSGLLNKEF